MPAGIGAKATDVKPVGPFRQNHDAVEFQNTSS
jgi:hypothetical protein